MSFLQYLINGISIGAVYAIIALGYTMVYGIAKMLNFAHGDVIMVGAYISYCVTNYLGLPGDVISMLICYCKDRARQKGSMRNPSLRSIEKEAYAWAERGIDSMEEAAAFIQNQNVRNSRMKRLLNLLQIRGRNLTAAEERYAQSWLDMGLEEDAIAMAYERTCLNTGGLNCAYMNKILQRWQEQGFRSAEDVQSGDRKPVPKGASGELGKADYEIIQKMLQEG